MTQTSELRCQRRLIGRRSKSYTPASLIHLQSLTVLPAGRATWKRTPHLEYNLDSAKEYMAKSKYAGGVETDIVIPATPYLVSIADAALLIQSQLKKIGVSINLRTLDTGSFWGRYKDNSKFDTTMVVMMTPPTPQYLFFQGYYTGRFICQGQRGSLCRNMTNWLTRPTASRNEAEFE